MGTKNKNSDKFRDEIIEIGLKIGYLRRQRAMTQNQLADKADISVGFLSQIEAPNMAMSFSLSTLLAIAQALEVPPSKILEFD
ncbi:helix-turn-helix transcriptional regulator [Sedimentibacter hydroxybenzoicus DSM 7310]|uniref:Helix-turn-helix transcriptional regulator n=1 Tax=Sedimentibacter hydroxybenzoicus DSM 7310 TaxID=1123245 RepID=A0A974BIL8_SEDHY|nr:helix-turn-helix transcriptional regulator [Sedimentibacter hydroxybenzoicus]NYB73768.1 helix-turn-helix transcriptional regulator [Sedimentibacter hydroxybenzoicus DSM 7310]